MTNSTNKESTSNDPSADAPPFHWQQVLAATRRSWIGTRSRAADVPTMIGCSGGADSVALVRSLAAIWLSEKNDCTEPAPLWVAHFNHGLRGADSDADEQFVSELAKRLGLEFVSGRVSRAPRQSPIEDEAGLRQSRRHFFQSTAERLGCRYIAVAHSADDQVETLLHHLLRGSGPLGLGGIPPTSPLGTDVVLRRPMLDVPRDVIRNGLLELGQTWREDASNFESRYTRNWLRNEVLPLIEQRFPHVTHSIARASQLQFETNAMVQSWALRWLDMYTSFDAEGWIVNVNALQHERDSNVDCDGPPIWSTERPIVISAAQTAWDRKKWPRRAMALEHWRRLADWICAPGSIDVSGNHWPGGVRVEQRNEHIRFVRPD